MNLLKSIFGTSGTSMSAAEAKTHIDSGKPPFILDVREPSEYKAGHIAGSKLIPLGDLSKRIDELPKDREILCVCRSGSRSSAAARQLTNAGYTTINLRGGMTSWEMSGYPVKKGK